MLFIFVLSLVCYTSALPGNRVEPRSPIKWKEWKDHFFKDHRSKWIFSKGNFSNGNFSNWKPIPIDGPNDLPIATPSLPDTFVYRSTFVSGSGSVSASAFAGNGLEPRKPINLKGHLLNGRRSIPTRSRNNFLGATPSLPVPSVNPSTLSLKPRAEVKVPPKTSPNNSPTPSPSLLGPVASGNGIGITRFRTSLNETNNTLTEPQDNGGYQFLRGTDGKYYYVGPRPSPPKPMFQAQGFKERGDFNDSEGLCGPNGGDAWRLTPENWKAAKVDENIQRFLSGQNDTQGLQWIKNQDPPLPFSAWLGQQMTNSATFNCSLENPCVSDLNCDLIGQGRRDGSSDFIRSRWGYFALTALRNLNLQLSNSYASLDGAQIDNTLSTFTIDDFYAKSNQQFGLRNFLIGLGTLLGVVGGFLPSLSAPIVGAAGAIAPAIGGFIGNKIAATSPEELATSAFSGFVKNIYSTIRASLDFGAADIFAGKTVGTPGANITQMFEGGSWINSSQLTPLADLTNATAKELFARSVNALWHTFSSNKIWITYLNLEDPTNAKCAQDTTGPPDSKYCSESGVYYLYNFKEEQVTGGEGYNDYPWGAEKLPSLGITLPRLVESSVRSGFVAGASGGDKYNYNQLNGTTYILQQAIANPGQLPGLFSGAGHLPGTWTIPVCNMGTWGKMWNKDYTRTTNKNDKGSVLPCMCGPGGTETGAWATAAGLKNFQSYYRYCKSVLTIKELGFVWPEGVTSVNLGFGDTINKPD